MSKKETKYIFVTGGVTSSLGKGIVSASLGLLLKSRGFKVTIQKLDPYINIDPGTLNPYEHGECYVTEDGAETDLDLGHYERFLDSPTSQNKTLQPEESTRLLSRKNVKVIFLEKQFRSSHILPTRSNAESKSFPKKTTTSLLLRSEEQLVILNLCLT